MSASRTAGRLVRCYPAGWRERYGEELETLILDMSGGGRVPWRVRAEVATAGGRERLRTLGCAGHQTPDGRVRGGLLLVLWAWALFVLGGAIVQKSSEHWQQAMPPGGRSAATVAFGALVGLALAASALVLVGIAVAVPSLRAFVRDGGWPRLRRPVLGAALATLVLLGVTAGLVAWAHGLSAQARQGHDTAYAIGFLGWGALAAGTLLAWTAVAARIARALSLRPATLRVQTRLATAVSVAMGAMALATGVWWVTLARVAPSALTGGADGGHASAFGPPLVLAAALMLVATGLGVTGVRQATSALPGLARGSR